MTAAKSACPVCGAPTVPKYRPFCSPRCADVDLGRWLKGGYRIPTDEKPVNGLGPDGAPDDDDA